MIFFFIDVTRQKYNFLLMDCIFYDKIEPNIFLRVYRLIHHVRANFKCSLNIGAILSFYPFN